LNVETINPQNTDKDTVLTRFLFICCRCRRTFHFQAHEENCDVDQSFDGSGSGIENCAVNVFIKSVIEKCFFFLKKIAINIFGYFFAEDMNKVRHGSGSRESSSGVNHIGSTSLDTGDDGGFYPVRTTPVDKLSVDHDGLTGHGAVEVHHGRSLLTQPDHAGLHHLSGDKFFENAG